MRPTTLRSLVTLCLAAVVLAVCETSADSVGACQTRCVVGADKCRGPKKTMLDGCAKLYNCDNPACQNDGECSFGCARCANMWGYQLNECDRTRDECHARCATLGDDA